jgi:hypothetical protein
LFRHLRTHPDLFAPPGKDLYFFDRYYERGLHWYASQFDDGAQAAVRIEFSHDYLFSPLACRRVGRDLDRPRFVVGLRDPVSYLRSTIDNMRRNGSTPSQIARIAESGRLVAGCVATDFVADWLSNHPRDAFLFFRFDELVQSPSAVYQRVLAHLGLGHSVPDDIEAPVNPTQSPRAATLARATRSGAQVARRLGLSNAVGRVKSSSVITGALYSSPRTVSAATDSEHDRALREMTRPAVERLARLIGQPELAASWGYV